jgi:hypothetical protein
VPKVAYLRKQADLYRRIASIPTEGGRREDRVLLVIADNLEREAAAFEERNAAPMTGDVIRSRECGV